MPRSCRSRVARARCTQSGDARSRAPARRARARSIAAGSVHRGSGGRSARRRNLPSATTIAIAHSRPHGRIVGSQPPASPIPARPRDPASRCTCARRARGGAAVPARRHRDRRAPRHDAAGRAGARRAVLSTVVALCNFLTYGDDRAGRAPARGGRARACRRAGGPGALACGGDRLGLGGRLRALAAPLMTLLGGAGHVADLAARYLRLALARRCRSRSIALAGQGWLRGMGRLREPLGDPCRRQRRERRPRGDLGLRASTAGLDGRAVGTVIAQLGMGGAFAALLLRRTRLVTPRVMARNAAS